MTYAYIVEDSSFENIMDDPDFYLGMFNESKVLAFPELNLNAEQHLQVMNALGFKNTSQGAEDHYDTLKSEWATNSPDEALINWHLENLQMKNPQIVAGWNMTTFTCPEGHGNTGMVNMIEVYEDLDVETKEFYEQVNYVFMHDPSGRASWMDEAREEMLLGNKVIPLESVPTEELPVRKAVVSHPRTGETTLRYMCSPNCVVLPLQDKNMDQTNEQKRIFDKEIKEKIRDPEYQLWWEWAKGDLVIVDLFCIYHSVKGGFTVGERILDRIYEYG